jgi:hypothetical protein
VLSFHREPELVSQCGDEVDSLKPRSDLLQFREVGPRRALHIRMQAVTV